MKNGFDDPRQYIKYRGNKHAPGNPLWDIYEDTRTGKTTYEEYSPVEVKMCSENKHYFQVIDSNGNYQCRNCPLGGRIAWGIFLIQDGKLIKNEPKS